EEATSGEHLPQDDPQGEDVDALVDRLLHHRLGREVAELALDDAGVALRELARRLREAEVHDLHLAVLRDEDVGGGDVAVDDLERLAVALELVGVGEALADAPCDVDGRLDRDGTGELARVVHHRLEIRAVDVLHDDEVRPVADADVEDADDVGMREVRGEARLVEEHGDELLFLAELRQDALDRDLLAEALDAGALGDEHLRHAAGCQALEDAVSLLLAHSSRLASATPNLAPVAPPGAHFSRSPAAALYTPGRRWQGSRSAPPVTPTSSPRGTPTGPSCGSRSRRWSRCWRRAW